MVSVLLSWGVISFAAYGTGIACLRLLRLLPGISGLLGKDGGGAHADALSVMVCGAVGLTLYAQVFSLFGGVGIFALAAALIFSACFVLDEGRRGGPGKGRPGISHAAAVTVLLLVCAYCTSRGYMHYDSDLYHAQSIRWIESLGAVPGLANLHNRLGYNSAFFALQALFSFSRLTGRSLHTVNGWLFFIVSLRCLEGFSGGLYRRSTEGGRSRAALYFAVCLLRLSCVYYLVNIADEVVSPASDYTMVLLCFYLLIRWLDTALLYGDDALSDHCLLSLLSVFVVSVKLSAAMLMLLALLPGLQLWKKKRGDALACFVALGALLLVPFALRNVVLTGYVLYPFPSLDLFDLDWKVPAGAALADAREIKVWGRGYTDLTLYDAPLSFWFPGWFRSLSFLDKAAFVMALCGMTAGTAALFAGGRGRDKATTAVLRHVHLCLSACCLFWFFQAPLIRYGCAFLYALCGLDLGIGLGALLPRRGRKYVLLLITALFLLWKGRGFVLSQLRLLDAPCYVVQQDYGTYPTASYSIGEETFFYPTEGDQCGYAAFPSAPTRRDGRIRLRGKSLKDGFSALEE